MKWIIFALAVSGGKYDTGQSRQPEIHYVQQQVDAAPSQRFPGRYVACEKPDDGFRPYIQRFSFKEMCSSNIKAKSRSSTRCKVVSILPNASINTPYATVSKSGRLVELYDLVQDGVGMRLAVPKCVSY